MKVVSSIVVSSVIRSIRYIFVFNYKLKYLNILHFIYNNFPVRLEFQFSGFSTFIYWVFTEGIDHRNCALSVCRKTLKIYIITLGFFSYFFVFSLFLLFLSIQFSFSLVSHSETILSFLEAFCKVRDFSLSFYGLFIGSAPGKIVYYPRAHHVHNK